VCHDTINRGLLEMDYTCCVCLDHLSESEARSLEFEIELAQTVQRSLLPQEVPDTEYLEIAAFSRPAQFISGDYFDFFRFRDGAHGLAIADVAGHGISASLHMASLQALLRTLIPISDSAAEVVDRLQGLLVHNVRFSNFVTLFLGAYDEASHRLVYANAGHNPPLVLRRDPKVPDLRRDEAVKPDTGPDEAPDGGETWLWPTGPAVGLIEHPGYTTGMLQLYPGDLVLMYTDGVTEAENPSGQQYDRPRLAQAVRRFRRLPARDLVHSILEDLQAYTAGKPLADDATLLACRIVR
jgi:sigma-B regulation protein RsbU (phosphoserine phosphatase)